MENFGINYEVTKQLEAWNNRVTDRIFEGKNKCVTSFEDNLRNRIIFKWCGAESERG